MDRLRLVLATANPGKAVEVRAALPDVTVETLADHPQLTSAVEDGATFIDNARIKAEAVARSLGVAALADDSGLAVDALQGAPGVLSARYAEGTDEDRYRKLLSALHDVSDADRTARFVCAMAFIRPGEPAVFTEGHCEGHILRAPSRRWWVWVRSGLRLARRPNHGSAHNGGKEPHLSPGPGPSRPDARSKAPLWAMTQSSACRRLRLTALSAASGCGAVWLAHLVWDQGVEGSNPFAPIS